MRFINGKNILIAIIVLLSVISLIAGLVTVTTPGKGVYYFLNPDVWNCTGDVADCKTKMEVAQAAGRNWIGAWFFVTSILLVGVAIFTGFSTLPGGAVQNYIEDHQGIAEQ